MIARILVESNIYGLAAGLPLSGRMVMAMKRMMLAAVAAGILLVPAWAQDPNPGDDGGDAPEHGVARLSLIHGDVSVRHGDQGEMTAGAINAPLVTTDQVMT